MSHLHAIDYAVLVVFFLITLFIGWRTMRKAGQSSSEFFLSGRSTPWWLLGFSLVATTFSADTPNLVTDIVRQNGVAGNWVWWAFLPTGLTTVFIYAKLWRKLGVTTDIEFYETRYSGKSGAFALRSASRHRRRVTGPAGERPSRWALFSSRFPRHRRT